MSRGWQRCRRAGASAAENSFAEAVVDEKNILLGTLVTNGQKKISIGCPDKLFTRHMLIVGTPGTGKTTFSVHLLLQFARRGIPFLAPSSLPRQSTAGDDRQCEKSAGVYAGK